MPAEPKKLTAKDIIALLAARHSEDVFVPECKTGPSVNGLRRLDGWAMKKSWSNPLVIGYEVKVSRSDFTRDDKWHDYLEFCNELYFACPHGLIAPEELPPEAGLLWVTKTGSRLQKKKAAARRREQITEDVFRYILMARARIVDPGMFHTAQAETKAERRAKWERFAAERADDAKVGQMVRGRIGQAILAQQMENDRLRREHDKLEHVRQRIVELGFDPERPVDSWRVHNALDRLGGAVPGGVRANVERALHSLKALQDAIDAIDQAEADRNAAADSVGMRRVV